MSWPMFRKAIRDLRWTTLWYGAGLALYISLLTAFYPSLQSAVGEVEQILERYPELLFRVFGIDPTRVLFTSFAGFMSAEVFGFIWPAVALIFVILSGAAVVAQEIERGTAEFWLSVPVTRVRLLFSKYVALVLAILVLTGSSVLVLAVGAALVQGELTTRGTLRLFLVLTSMLIAFGGLAVFASSITNERSRAAGLVGGLLLLMYLAWVVAGLSGEVQWLRYFSLLTAYDPQTAMVGGLAWYKPVLHLVVGIVSGAAGLFLFARRDILS